MAETNENTPKETVREYGEEEEGEDQSFEELGLDSRLVHALLKKGIEKPTPIQRVAIPLILVTFILYQLQNYINFFQLQFSIN